MEDDTQKEFDKLLAQIASNQPLEVSEETRTLAQAIVAQQKYEQEHPLSAQEIKQWAQDLVTSMYQEK